MSGGNIFVTARWTQVLAAQGRSATALADLCAAYYTPVHAYIARTAHDLGDPRAGHNRGIHPRRHFPRNVQDIARAVRHYSQASQRMGGGEAR